MILVTGGADYINTHTCLGLQDADYKSEVHDNLGISREEPQHQVPRMTRKTLRCIHERHPSRHDDPLAEPKDGSAQVAKPDGFLASQRYFHPHDEHESGQIGGDQNDIPSNLMPFISQVVVVNSDTIKVSSGSYPRVNSQEWKSLQPALRSLRLEPKERNKAFRY